MSKLVTVLLASAVAASTAGVVQAQSYPWEVNSSQPSSTTQGLTVQQTATPSSGPVPVAPSMKSNPIFGATKTQDASQPAVSEAADYDFNNAPAPPAYAPGEEPYQSVVDQNAPQLSVQSNAATAADQPNYCGRDCRRKCDLGCIKRLFGTAPSGLEVGGWASFGYHNRDNIIFNDRRGTLNPHQVWLYAEQAAERNAGWDIGYRFDGLYGIDAQNTQAFGNRPTGNPDHWDNGWDNGEFGFALPQAYLQFANECWDVKAGKFFSPFGYEVVAAPDNFFYSHNYIFNFTEPFTMTGILGERQISQNRSLILGVTTGWDTGFNQNQDGLNLITGMRFSPNENVNLAVTSSLGDTGYRGTGRMTSGVADLQLTENVNYVIQGNYLDLQDNQEFGIVNYLFREVNCCLALGARLEWWKSDQIFGGDTRSTYEFTMGANYRANANIRLRPEVRWDWGAAAIEPGQAIVGIDAIVLF